MDEISKDEFRVKQIDVKAKEAGRGRLVSTYRPVEIMFAATGKEPTDLRGKEILNLGAGRTHWGFELTSKYKVVAKKFENFDISYAEQSGPRRLAGKIFMAESIGDIKNELPYRDNSFDVLWCSYAPTNWQEFVRITKPGGEIFVLGGNYDEEFTERLSHQLGIPVTCQKIDERKIDKWASLAGRHRNAVSSLLGKNVLVVKKPKEEIRE
ncbi:MAG TPA: methyltransferase domain-containing protein [Patescibacteria group bacterium]|nr:methyltransferase domain-containing protein [Patescibacteria group bacterium]